MLVPLAPSQRRAHRPVRRRRAVRWAIQVVLIAGVLLGIGTPALATRGLQREDFLEVGTIIAAALAPGFEDRAEELAARVRAIVERYPLYEGLAARVPA